MKRVETQSHSPRVSLEKKEVIGDTVLQSQIKFSKFRKKGGKWRHSVSTHFTTHPQSLTISWDCGTVIPLILLTILFNKTLKIRYRKYLYREKYMEEKTGCIIYLFRTMPGGSCFSNGKWARKRFINIKFYYYEGKILRAIV